MLCKVELLVPYADGGSLAELHELAGDLSTKGHARGRAGQGAGADEERPSASPSSPSRLSVCSGASS